MELLLWSFGWQPVCCTCSQHQTLGLDKVCRMQHCCAVDATAHQESHQNTLLLNKNHTYRHFAVMEILVRGQVEVPESELVASTHCMKQNTMCAILVPVMWHFVSHSLPSTYTCGGRGLQTYNTIPDALFFLHSMAGQSFAAKPIMQIGMCRRQWHRH